MNEAGAAFEEELKLAPNDIYSNFFIGVVASSENNHEKAIRFLLSAVELDGRRGEAFLFLAQSQIEREDLAGAEKSLRRAVELEGANREKDFQARRTHFLLGRVLVRTGRKEEGERELAIARELQEKSIQSARDEITQILGQVVDAATPAPLPVEQNTDVRIKLAPERAAELVRIKNGLSDITAQAFFNLGVIAVQGGRAAEALLNFESTSRWKADFPNLDRSRGIVAFRAGKFDRVVEPLRRHLAKTPGDALARRMLGASHYFLRDFAAAADVLKPIGAAIVNDAELAYFYGISLIQLKRNADDATLFGELARISQDQPDALFYAAQGFMILGDFERSVREIIA